MSTTGFYSVSVAAVSGAGTGTAATTDNPVTPTVQLASSTVVLTQATMDALASNESVCGGSSFRCAARWGKCPKQTGAVAA